MAAVIKELLFDIVDNKIVHHDVDKLIRSGHSVAWEYLPGWEDQCIAQCDVQLALEDMVYTLQVDEYDILLLSKFLSGFSTNELEVDFPHCKERLIIILALLENATKYTDERYLESVVRKYPKFQKTKEAYAAKLFEAGRIFE